MIGALISLLSLELSRRLIAAGVIAHTFTVTDATNTTPIVVTTSVAHNIPPGRVAHGVVANVGGNTGANGVFVMTPVTTTTLQLSRYTEQGVVENSVGTGAYTSGGTIKIAFPIPDGGILLGRRNVAMQMALTTPRIVFVPQGSPAWTLNPYGGVIPPITALPRSRSGETAEQQTMKLQRQLATELHRFEVHVYGSATNIGYSAPSPDFGDFDATQYLYHQLYAVGFDLISPDRFKVLGGKWVSQEETIQTLDTRGQKWVAIIEIQQPVTDMALEFLPANTSAQLTVALSSTSTESVVIDIPVS